MGNSNLGVLFHNFMGHHTPIWYKKIILGFFVLNFILLELFGGFVTGWFLVVEFIFCLAMALKCYPLLPGGLLALQAVTLGMTTPEHVMTEVSHNIEVVLLLVFMVAGIHFMKDLLAFTFTKVLLQVRSKVMLALSFMGMGAFLSAFLDALTVIAVVIAVATAFWDVYHEAQSDRANRPEFRGHEISKGELEQFRLFLTSLVMHAAIGTALGGVCTMVGEPQNLVIASKASWDFWEFFFRMAPVSIPVLFAGLFTCVLVEKFQIFGFGATMPDDVRFVLTSQDKKNSAERTKSDVMNLWVQGVIGIILILSLATHIASVGLIGLMIIILLALFTGVSDEHKIGKAFTEALPFTALLVVFFAIVAVIIDQKLFTPVIHWALSFEGNTRYVIFYFANGFLSMVSDNVFVGTVYINEAYSAWQAGSITRDQFDNLAVAINTGTNLPSVATPNGQAAFLFLLTSGLAIVLRLSYGKMVWMALPFTIVMTTVGFLCVQFTLLPATEWMYANEWISHHAAQALDAVKSGH